MSAPSFLLARPDALDGIGPVRAAALDRAGVGNIAEMFRRGPLRVHRVCPDASAAEVGQWFCQAALLRIRGMTAPLARAFVRAGLRSLPRVADAELLGLEAAAAEAGAFGPHELARLQQAAWRLQSTGMLAGRLLHRNGQPIRGARVDLGASEERTDAHGWYAFDSVRPGTVRLRIEIEGRGRLPTELRPITVRAGKLAGPFVVRLAPVHGAALPRLFEIDGPPMVHTAATRVELVWRDLESFADGTLLQIRSLNQDGSARLLSFFKERVGPVILVPRARLDAALLPPGARVGDVLRLDAGQLQPTSLSTKDVAELKRERWLAARTRTTRRMILVGAERSR